MLFSVTNRVFIMGDSILKHTRSYELSQRVENCKVFVKSFSGAKVRCTEVYVHPTLRETFHVEGFLFKRFLLSITNYFFGLRRRILKEPSYFVFRIISSLFYCRMKSI